MGAPHPLLAGDLDRTEPKSAVLARVLFAYAALLFVGGVAFAVLNGFSPEESWSDFVTSFFFPLVPLAFAAAGLAIASREASSPLGWIALAVGIAGLGPLFPGGYARYATLTNPGGLPLGDLSAWIEEWSWIAWALAGMFFLLLFPDGKLLSPRWKPAAALGAVASGMSFAAVAFQPGPLRFNPVASNPFGLAGADSLLDLLAAGLVLLPVSLLIAGTSVVLRFLRSQGEQRLQVKWLIVAASAVAMAHVASALSAAGHSALLGPPPAQPAASPSTMAVVQGIATMTWMLIPGAAGVAVLKHRIDRVDAVIRNVVAVLVAAAALVGAYTVAVVVLSLAVGSSPRPGVVSSVGAGLLVALLFPAVKAWAGRVAGRATGTGGSGGSVAEPSPSGAATPV